MTLVQPVDYLLHRSYSNKYKILKMGASVTINNRHYGNFLTEASYLPTWKKTENVVCVYDGIGQKASTIAQVVNVLDEKLWREHF